MGVRRSVHFEEDLSFAGAEGSMGETAIDQDGTAFDRHNIPWSQISTSDLGALEVVRATWVFLLKQIGVAASRPL